MQGHGLVPQVPLDPLLIDIAWLEAVAPEPATELIDGLQRRYRVLLTVALLDVPIGEPIHVSSQRTLVQSLPLTAATENQSRNAHISSDASNNPRQRTPDYAECTNRRMPEELACS